jgi:Na+/H+-dicarboxylate symporter
MFGKYKILFMLSSCWMMGIGFRFIMMKETDTYGFSWFDKFFDWGVLFVLGLILFLFVVWDYIKEDREVKET